MNRNSIVHNLAIQLFKGYKDLELNCIATASQSFETKSFFSVIIFEVKFDITNRKILDWNCQISDLPFSLIISKDKPLKTDYLETTTLALDIANEVIDLLTKKIKK